MRSTPIHQRTYSFLKLFSSFGFIALLLTSLLFLTDKTQEAKIVKNTIVKTTKTNSLFPSLNGEEAKEYLKEQGLYSSLAEAMQAARYSINPTKNARLSNSKEGFKANNPRQAFSTYFAKDGIHLVSKVKNNEWRVQMNLKGYGYDNNLTTVNQSKMEVQKNKSRIEIEKHSQIGNHKSQITEWYENTSNGLEQGWTIAKRLPNKQREEEIQLVLNLAGDLKAKLAKDKQSISFVKENDEAVLRYDKLKSWDANGKELVSRMELDGNQLSIVVKEKEAKYPITIDPFFTQTKKLTASDGAVNDQFGWSVGISGNTAIVGSHFDDDAGSSSGSAYVFERNTGGSENWGEVKKLTASDAAAGDEFGFAVAVSVDTIIVGARLNDDTASNSGSAYIFGRNQGGIDNWGEVKKVTASDAANSDYYGEAVAISGDTAIVVAWRNDDAGTNSGSVYILERNQGGADNWGEVKKITASDAATFDNWGYAVSIFGDTLVVGSPDDDDDGSGSGSAYIFERNFDPLNPGTPSANNWGEVKKITASDAAASDSFGWSAGISGDTVIIGSVLNDDDGTNSGSAYIFERNQGGANNWGEVKKLTASDAATGDWFGWSVAISNDTVIVGAYLNDDSPNDSGSAYIFERNIGGADNWGQAQKLTASDAAGGDQFGHSVSISGGTAIVGANLDDIVPPPLVSEEKLGAINIDQGSAYIFTNQNNNWQQVSKSLSTDGTASDEFGYSVAISGHTAVVGARADDDAGDSSGSAYVFERNTGGLDNWGQVQKLTASDGAIFDQFGWAVGISADTIIVGALADDDAGTSSGSAYIFERNTGGVNNWGQVKKLTASDAAAMDAFGQSVGISGDTVVIGAYLNDDTGSSSGSAYVFERNSDGMGGTSANNWGEVKKLTASDAAAGDQFGFSSAISGDTVIVGAHQNDDVPSNSGSAYIFERNTGGSENWGQVQKLTASDAAASDEFGRSVFISNDTAIVGTPSDDNGGFTNSGSAYIFERNQGGVNNWGQVKKITASDAFALDNFGYSVGISGDKVIVGSWGDDDNGSSSGSVYIFERNQGGADNWGELSKRNASDGAANDRFGFAVAISGDFAVAGAHFTDIAALSGSPGKNRNNKKSQNLAGADQGAVYVFNAVAAPTAASVSISGRVVTSNGRGIKNAIVQLLNSAGETETRRTNSFGYFRFNNVQTSETYIATVFSKQYIFSTQVITVTEKFDQLEFRAVASN